MPTHPTDRRYARILENVPREMLTSLVRKQSNHNPEKLSKDKSDLVAEAFRLLSDSMLDTLYEEYPGPPNFAVWFFDSRENITKSKLKGISGGRIATAGSSLLKLGKTPELYEVEHGSS